MENKFTAIDLFCGAGGVSQGMISSERVKILVAINHSIEAIEAHKKNNPGIVHLTEDIKNYERIFPFLPTKVNILWASAECTNLSNAKGGQSRDADSRSLPEYLPAYVRHCNPDFFMIENIKEFMVWAPLIPKLKNGKKQYDKKGDVIMHPDPRYRGVLYHRWIKKIEALGYQYQYRLLNAADFGAHTSRTRYFGVFAKPNLSISFPEPTHAKDPGLFDMKKWRPCKEKIDFDNEGISVFGRRYNKELPKHRRKPLAPKTMARIAYGLRKYHLNDFIAKAFNTPYNVSSMDEPLHNIDCNDRHAKIKVVKGYFISKQQFGEDQVSSIDQPLQTIVTKTRQQLVTCDKSFIIKQQGQKKGNKPYNGVSSTDEPLHTIMTSNRHAVIVLGDSKHFIAKKQGNKYNVASVDKPLYSILTKDDGGVISVRGHFITQNIHGANSVSDIDEPLGTILTEDEKVIITVDKSNFIGKKNSGKHQVHSVDEPLHTIMSNNDGKFLITIDPAAGMGKAAYNEKRKFFKTYFQEYDPDFLCLIISDIYMRYLTSFELSDITGFKKNTYLGKSETVRKKHIGNAVPPVLPKALINSTWDANVTYYQSAVA